MSLVVNSRDLSAGLTLGLDVSAPPVYGSGSSPVAAAHDNQAVAVVGMGVALRVPGFPGYLRRDGEKRAKLDIQTSFGGGESETSSESSSIGVPSESGGGGSGEEDGEEIESKPKGSFGSLASLEESLPIKRGLSNYFSGKSKSFANLSEVKGVKEMQKKENPLNKRRRITISYKWSKKSTFYGVKNPISMPLLALNEEDNNDHEGKEQSEDEEQEEDSANQEQEDDSSNQEQDDEKEHNSLDRKQLFRGSMSCFSLADLRK